MAELPRYCFFPRKSSPITRRSDAAQAELAKFKAAARATALKDKRVNIRLPCGDSLRVQD